NSTDTSMLECGGIDAVDGSAEIRSTSVFADRTCSSLTALPLPFCSVSVCRIGWATYASTNSAGPSTETVGAGGGASAIALEIRNDANRIAIGIRIQDLTRTSRKRGLMGQASTQFVSYKKKLTREGEFF